MRKRQLMVGVAAAATLLGGCHSGKQPVLPTPSPAQPSTPASLEPSAAAERDALAAYRGMWDAVVAAGRVSDPDAPDLRKYASNQALRLVVNNIYTNRAQKKVILGELKIDPQVTALKPATDPTEATIVDCFNDEKWLVYKASGGLVDHVPGGKHRTTATVKRTPDGWKVDSFILEEAGTC